jgi:hypothetical protein
MYFKTLGKGGFTILKNFQALDNFFHVFFESSKVTSHKIFIFYPAWGLALLFLNNGENIDYTT